MQRLPADVRRGQLIEAALAVTAQQGVAALTIRNVSEAAGVSLGVVHYHFEHKEELLTEMGQCLILEISEAMRLAFSQLVGPLELRGMAGLRELLGAGIRGLWPIIEASPDHQLLTYEITAQALRQRGAGNDSAGAIAAHQYRTMDTEAVAFLDLCAHRAGVTWSTPVDQIARFALAVLDGVVLRWLVDRDSGAALAALDDLVQIIATKARQDCSPDHHLEAAGDPSSPDGNR
ncbi:TetR family transcriptional regulator [Rhodococcus opacus]|uniref:TetR/AcrR family transcriptional regulator n=1 Tax=Rhodococcus opacus TaxID=37919 RepID=UPI001FF273BA|nr:TetR family transcriptional regulator [Rhodococcus opacus]UOT04053.1 TetR family transcriptional regulator [Rhodococcus opacus]